MAKSSFHGIVNAGALALGCLLAPAANAASFDCTAAKAPHEIAICSDEGLSRQDDDMAVFYREALERADDKEAVKREQRAWLARTRACGSDADCLMEAYTARSEELSGLTSISEEMEAPDLPDERADSQNVIAPPEPAQTAESEPASRTPERNAEQGQEVSADPAASAMLGVIALGLIVMVIGSLIATRWLARRTSEKYGWNMILNWWNLLHLAAAGVLLFGGMTVGLSPGLVIFAAGLWMIVLIVNIKNTSLGTGLAISVIQPFVVFILWMVAGLFQAYRQQSQRR